MANTEDIMDDDFVLPPIPCVSEDLAAIPEVVGDEDPDSPDRPPVSVQAISLNDIELGPPNPFTSGTNPLYNFDTDTDDGQTTDDQGGEADTEDDDIEALRARACALASTPIPDYADAFRRKNKKYRTKKHRDKVLARRRRDKDPNSIILANKTSNILNNFQDYINEIETEEAHDSIDSFIGDVKTVKTKGAAEEFGYLPKKGMTRGVIAREWTYNDSEGNVKRRGSGDNIHDIMDELNHAKEIALDKSGHGKERRMRYIFYRHPVFYSKKFKVAVAWVIVLCVLIITIIAISSSGGQKPNSEEAFLERVEGMDNGHTGANQEDNEYDQFLEANENRDKQWSSGADKEQNENTLLTTHKNDADEQNEADAQILPHHVIGLPSEVEQKSEPSASAAEVIVEAIDIKERYDPQWFARATGWSGSSYSESIDFCASKKMSLCPYNAYCSTNKEGTKDLYNENKIYPNGGSILAQWSAAMNDVNEWIQIGPYNKCMRYRDMYSGPPEWGLDGKGSQLITQHILCCKPDGNLDGNENSNELDEKDALPSDDAASASIALEQPPTINEQDAYNTIIDQYKPQEFSRKQGWHGKTYQEAFEFCGKVKGNTSEGNYGICPYKAICPLGLDSQPLGGYKGGDDGKSSIWMPISDQENDYVQLSQNEDACVRFSHENPQLPEWGVTGDANAYDFISRVMCCLSSDTESIEGPGANADIDAEEHQMEEQSMGDDIVSQEVGQKPAIASMYDRSSGWKGQTYLEAIQFCQKQNGYHICPYDAICPEGLKSSIEGFHNENEGGSSWLPISDDANDWVDLSSDNACVRYTSAKSDHPEWGMTGDGNEILTRNIMCCEGSVLGGAEESFMYKFAAEKYHPMWFDRSDGWDGNTYQEAVLFCQEQNGLSLCPYLAYCPMAELNKPLGGAMKEENIVAPMYEGSTAWVSLGTANTCEIQTAPSTKEVTSHVMCCENDIRGEIQESEQQSATGSTNILDENEQSARNPTPLPTPAPTSSPTKLATSPPTPKESTLNPTLPLATANAGMMEVATGSVWYGRSSGWIGQTYDEAQRFCSKQGPDYEVCSFDKYCPDGENSTPIGGTKDEPNGSWAPIDDSFNDWIDVSSNKPCVRFTTMNGNHPDWGLTGEGNEDITRHIMCCSYDNIEEGTLTVSKEITGNLDDSDVEEIYAPKWYHRDEKSGNGWVGKSFSDAISFCAMNDSQIPCPYEAYCPHGPGSTPTGGSRKMRQSWAPIMDIPNGWVNVGPSSDSCELYNSIHPHPPFWGLHGRHSTEKPELDEDVKDITADIMCCREPLDNKQTSLQTSLSGPAPIADTKYEQDILDKKHPIWFSRKHGYHGTTHEDAADFCASIGDMVLCPHDTYCPEGSQKPLFLQKDAFAGEQWAPVATTDTRSSHQWILVGELGGESQSTCATFGDVKGMKPSGWNVDDADPSVKENVLCCMNPNRLLKQNNFAKDLDPIWLGESFGWKGGSHQDAVDFCKSLGNKRLCPYAGYCPHGAGQSVMGGHIMDLNMEGEQWAPVHSTSSSNYWVQVGQKYQNSATTCMDNWELEGHEPSWGLSDERPELKKNIMCCTF